jgi:4-amino-4-deoxy-L-arabinose transferase-like glycosyltransferase
MIDKFLKYKYYWLGGLIAIIYFFNLFIDMMEIDAAQYAYISMEMLNSKSFLEVYFYGKDYLDKPPLIFWVSSLSYWLFGVSNFAYKLPSVLALLLGIYSTYRFGKIWYNKQKALLAAIILASSQAVFLISNDIRTDTLLLSWVIFSFWQISAYLKTEKWIHFLLGSLGIGLGMMSKGPIALIVVGSGFFFHFLLNKQWKNIFKWQWILSAIIILLSLLPMLYGLYHQYDLHPEKKVYGLLGPSGIKFFFWTQSFGRITGEMYWDNGTGFFFFFHTILWDFQPWIWLFLAALFYRFKNLIFNRKELLSTTEMISFSAFVLVFIALSNSSFKLPHYIFVLFPLASIITSDFVFQLSDLAKRKFARFQYGIMHIFWLIIPTYFILIFHPNNFFLPLLLLLLFVLFQFLFFKTQKINKLVLPSLLTIISLNLVMTFSFYPELLKYQSTSIAGREILEMEKEGEKIYNFKSTAIRLM